MRVDATALTVAMALFAVYYVGLFAVMSVRRRGDLSSRADGDATRFATVLIVPAHNEELVIASTIEGLLEQDTQSDLLILVMNDGSTDRTSEIARRYEPTRSVYVVDRPASVAGRGKGTVLNHAYRIVLQLLDAGHPRLRGRVADDVIIGVVDADGVLDRHTLSSVLPYFLAGDVAGVQIGVSIANAERSFLARLQDMEFVGFSGYVQEARDAFGSVGLGGNGQFTRLSALACLDGVPWSDCLTEDLDLGLRLVEDGWRVRYCGDAFVHQQGLESLRPLFRQRTRWFQGHYQCWRHLPDLARSPLIPRRTKIDVSLYLVLVVFVLVITLGAILSVSDALGVVTTTNAVLERLPSAMWTRATMLAISIAPLAGFVWTYQRRSPHRLRWWELPAFSAAFVLFTYSMSIAQLRAWARMAARRESWAKTARVAVPT